MKRMSRMQVLLPITVLVIASGTAWALQTRIKLAMNGRVISTEIQTIQGRAYVPLNDVAKALHMTVVKKGNTYSLTRAGGTNQVRGNTGKMNANLFSGEWRLKVASVQQVSGYSPRYGSDKQEIAPKEAGDVLIVIQCHLKNGAKEMQEVYFDKDSSGNTALTDDQEHGYVPLAYDSSNSGYGSDKMPSGSTHDFVVIFSVPKGANLKDMVYSVETSGMDKSADFRVSLKP